MDSSFGKKYYGKYRGSVLNNIDPTRVMKQPTGKVDQPNISYRFSGEDLVNPLAFAMLMKTGNAPSPQELEAAKQAIIAAQIPPGQAPPAAPAIPQQERIGPGLDPIVKRGDE